MTRVLVLGANGQIARVAMTLFLERTSAELTLYLRNAVRLERLSGKDRPCCIDQPVDEVIPSLRGFI